MKRGWVLRIVGCVMLLAAVGCGNSGAGGGGGESSEPADGIKRRELSSLPAAGDELPMNDGGRVTLFQLEPAKDPLKSWVVAPRSAQYLVRFSQRSGPNPPNIIITAQPTTFTDVDTVTLENVVEFSDKVQTSLDSSEKKLNVLEAPKPMLLGSNPWVRYVRAGTRPSTISKIDRQFLVTVVNGRQYTIELITDAGKLTQARDDAYAIAAHIKFNASGIAPPATPAAPENTPAAPVDPAANPPAKDAAADAENK